MHYTLYKNMHYILHNGIFGLGKIGKKVELLRGFHLKILLTLKNASSIVIVKPFYHVPSKVYNEKSRHISLSHDVKSSEKLANLFLKPLARDTVRSTSRGIGLKLLD